MTGTFTAAAPSGIKSENVTALSPTIQLSGGVIAIDLQDGSILNTHTVSVTNLLGQSILQEVLSPGINHTKMDVSTLPVGYYLVSVFDERKRIVTVCIIK